MREGTFVGPVSSEKRRQEPVWAWSPANNERRSLRRTRSKNRKCGTDVCPVTAVSQAGIIVII